jgi:glycosyltransferase involved in cell wall biosynthesis
MGRLNQIKGPDLLLRAYIKAHSNISEYHLVFAGPNDGMLDSLINEVKLAGLSNKVHFIGYVSGKNKSAAYHESKLLVVPSRQEAMSIVAIEAGFCGTPVLLTDQCGFSEVLEIDFRMEVAATVDDISAGLINILNSKNELIEISPVWKNFVIKHYSWNNLVDRYIRMYEKL